MWLIPLINHCTMYNDSKAEHPTYWLSLAATICVTSIGAVDCLIFSLRERPWGHIASSDGSFWGSFVWWRDGGSAARQPSSSSSHVTPGDGVR